MINIDDAEMTNWAYRLDAAIASAPDESAKIIASTALRVKRSAQRRISGRPHLPWYPYSIGYDIYMDASGPSAEIGPDKGRPQGALGNLIEFGSVNNAPIPHIAPAIDEHMPQHHQEMLALAERLLAGR